MTPQQQIANIASAARRVCTGQGDGRVAWRMWGRGRPLLLLHGAAGSWLHWIRNIEDLAASRTLLVPDMPGFGDSCDVPADVTGDDLAAPIAAGLPELAGAGAVDVVGFSFGGVVAAHLAAVAPGKVRRIVIVDSGGLGTPFRRCDTVPVRDAPDRSAAHRHNLAALMLHHRDAVDDLAVAVQARNVGGARLRATALVLPDRLSGALGRSTVPVDAIWGEHDRPHPDPHAQFAALRSVRPSARGFVVPDAGHWCIYEQPDAFRLCCASLLDL